MSSTTLKLLERPRWKLATVGLSGNDKEFDLVVARGGGLPAWYPLRLPRAELLLLAICDDAPSCCNKFWEQKLMFDLRRLLCLSNVFCALNGLGRTKYLELNLLIVRF